MKKTIVVVMTIGMFAITTIPVMAHGVHPAWHQYFEQNTEGWIGADVPGVAGWCGEITRYTLGGGPVSPSKGRGYAVVENSACNDYWQDNGWDESGPYAPFGGYSHSWPQGGFVTALDIYLDPSWENGTGFDFYVSMYLLNVDVNPARYFLFDVAKESDMLTVAGNEVSEAGWYTFRTKFRDEGGHLAVDFQLAKNGLVLFTQPVTSTAFTGEDPSTFEVSNVGTGYFWFHAISEGLELPIDQALYRPGTIMRSIAPAPMAGTH